MRRNPDCPKPHILDEDVDVAEERLRIHHSGKTNDILRVKDLSKVDIFFLKVCRADKVSMRQRFELHFLLFLPVQTYAGLMIPAVDQICVGVSPGEVGSVLLHTRESVTFIILSDFLFSQSSFAVFWSPRGKWCREDHNI